MPEAIRRSGGLGYSCEVLPSPAVLVVLIAPPGAGKTTLAHRWAPSSSVISSDAIRGELCGDESNQAVTAEVFAVLHHRVDERCRRGLTTVVDATSAECAHRKVLLTIAAQHALPSVALVLDTPLDECQHRNATRPQPRRVPAHVIAEQHTKITQAIPTLRAEGFTLVIVSSSDPVYDPLATSLGGSHA